MGLETLIQNTILTEGNILINFNYSINYFYLLSINNCPKNPKNVEIKKTISELQSTINKLEQKVEYMKIAAETKELFPVAVAKEFEEENAKFKEKYRKLKEKYNTYKADNQELVNKNCCF